MSNWTQEEATALCRMIEGICPTFGCHVALTGGLLYKDGLRKDADILFYRIREEPEIDISGLMAALSEAGIEPGNDYGWCYKASFNGKPIDFFFPDRDGEYPVPDNETISFDPILPEYTA